MYQLVTEAATDAARRGAEPPAGGAARHRGPPRAEATDEAPEPLAETVHAADRVWAAAGALVSGARADGTGGWIRAELPCA